jgi:hypothetical protein
MITVQPNNYTAWEENNRERICQMPDEESMLHLAETMPDTLKILIRSAKNLSSAALSLISHLKNVYSVSLREVPTSVMSEREVVWIYNILDQCQVLRILSLTCNDFSSHFFRYLGALGKNLTHLDLSELEGSTTDDSFKTMINGVTQVETLEINGFYKVTPTGLLAIKNLKKIKLLNFMKVPCIDDNFIDRLLKDSNSLPHLNFLRLDDSQITHLSLLTVNQRPGIETLSVVHSKKIPAEEFRVLKYNESLKQLWVCNTNADDRILQNLPPKLQTLCIHGCPITQEAVKAHQEKRSNVEVASDYPQPEKKPIQSTGWFSFFWG